MDAELPDGLRRALAATRARCVRAEHLGRVVFIKRLRESRLTFWGSVQAIAAALTLYAPLRPVRRADPRTALAREAEALQALSRAGFPVPAPVLVTDDALVVESFGTPVEALMGPADTSRRVALTRGAARSLSRLHAAGLWHGGAQLRNFTWLDDDRGAGMIDFEDHAGLDGVAPADRRFRDVVLFLMSVSRYGEAPTRAAIEELAGPETPETRAGLVRLRRMMAPFMPLLRAGTGVLGRDVRRAVALHDALAGLRS